MADDVQFIRSIHWKDVFPFSIIFRTFRVAIHPSKLILALVALLAVYVGGSLMDLLVPRSQLAVTDELGLYEEGSNNLDHDQYFNQLRDSEIADQQAQNAAQLQAIGKPDGNIADLRWHVRQNLDAAVKSARSPGERQQAYADASVQMAALDNQRIGLFATFSSYELGEVYTVVRAVRYLNFIGPRGVSNSIFRFFTTAPGWAIKHHPLFFTLYGLFFLIIWSVFGGAISRIAAVHFARDEKISIRQALAFSTSKFLSFVSAPIIPLLIISLIGLLVFAGGLVMNVPVLGPIVVGALYILILAAAFVMTLVLLGLLGGFNLMYPTIAVEGSDSFDAISRSFSYLYARPWRLAFYSLVAIAYGAVTYMFVRYFLYVLLSLAHLFTGMGVFTHAESSAPLLQAMWASPSAGGRLSYSINWLSLTPAERIGAGLLAFWVYLIVALLGAYAISFYFSVNTIIYYLMRREVDATDIDDVYLEQSDEDFGDVISKTEVTADGATVVTPVDVPTGNPVPPVGP